MLVAHNAGFDVSFLKAAARRTEHEWPGFPVLDTVHLARQLVHRDEVPNHRLASLARLFRATTTPDHRALHDARATVDVLHGLLERVGSLGVHSLEELLDYTARVTPARRRKRHLADDLPDLPGVYLFKDGQGRVLYVGTSVSIRTRVRSYFTASEHRRRMGEMVRIAESVSPIVCATTLEAEVRELRLIAEHKPRYNRRSRHPERALWVKLTVEPFPRLSIVRDVVDDGAQVHRSVRLPLGRRGGRRRRARGAAAAAVPRAALATPTALGVRPRRDGAVRCALHRSAVRRGLRSRSSTGPPASSPVTPGTCSPPCAGRMAELAGQQRFEDAQVVRDRLVALVRGTSRSQRLDPLARIPELVAARRTLLGGWEVVCVRHGRLAGTTTSPRGADPMPYIAALRASAEVVAAPLPPGHLRHAGGEREDPALARVPRGARRRGRRGVDLPRRRCGTRARRARAARDGPARGRGLRRRPLSAGHARRAAPAPCRLLAVPASDRPAHVSTLDRAARRRGRTRGAHGIRPVQEPAGPRAAASAAPRG